MSKMPTNEEINIIINKELEDKKMVGKVKWFNNEKGFGFIEREQGKDLFVHYQNIKGDGYRSLNDGDYVSFDVQETAKGEQAINVERIANE